MLKEFKRRTPSAGSDKTLLIGGGTYEYRAAVARAITIVHTAGLKTGTVKLNRKR